MKHSAFLVVIGLALFFTGSARADIYACEGRDGIVSFSEKRLKGQKCKLYSRMPKSKLQDRSQSPSMRAKSKSQPFGSSQRRPSLPLPPPSQGSTASPNEPSSLKEREMLYAPFIQEASALYKIPEAFIAAVIRVESSFRYQAQSEKGAMGLMQLMPLVVKEMKVQNPWDPRDNILGGTRLLRVLADRFQGDMVHVLAAYFAGSGAVSRAEGLPSERAESYARAVLDRYYEYKSRAD